MTTSSVAEDGTPNASARPRSKRAHAKRTPVAMRLRTLVAAVLVLAVLAAVRVASIAFVRGTWMVTPILSGSMRPGLAVGGVAISQRVPVHSLAVREVIVFQRPDNPSEQVVHRIVQLAVGSSGKIKINTQGDANTVRDPWTLTPVGDYAYRVRWSVPLVGPPDRLCRRRLSEPPWVRPPRGRHRPDRDRSDHGVRLTSPQRQR
jgi:signal peptidase I